MWRILQCGSRLGPKTIKLQELHSSGRELWAIKSNPKRWMLVGLFAFVISFVAETGYSQVIVAHRGASFDAPENTIAAFKEAWRQGADGIEGDFYVTKDQEIVCIHDKDTERTAGKKISVAGSTLAELRRLEYGSWKHKKYSGEPIPTFREVLQCVPDGKLFVIELKTGPEIVPILKQQLADHTGGAKDLLLIAFNADTVKACKKLLPDIRVHWLTGHKRDKFTFAWKPKFKEVVDTLRETGADGLGTQGEKTIVTKKYVTDLQARGLKEFHVWTIDDPADARYFQALGAIGITTNRPAFIRSALGL